jgi:hypothetical protein
MMQCVHRAQQVNTQQLGQLLVQTVLLEITHQAPGALTKKSVLQAPTVPTVALPSVWSVRKAKNPQRELLRVQIVGQTAFPLLGRQSANPVPPDKRSPPAGPVTKSKTTQQAPARGGKQQTSL